MSTSQQADADPDVSEMQERIVELEAQLQLDEAVIAELEADGTIEREKIANLEAALVTCRTIGMAMGILMNQHKATPDQAFAMLRAASGSRNIKVRELANDVVDTGTLDA